MCKNGKRRPEELIATYEWQSLHEWNTIPYGLDTRLSLAATNSAAKEDALSDVGNDQHLFRTYHVTNMDLSDVGNDQHFVSYLSRQTWIS